LKLNVTEIEFWIERPKTMILTSLPNPMSSTAAPEVVVLSNVYAQEGASHRHLKHRDTPSPPHDVNPPDNLHPVESWKKELSISATAYHSRGREVGQVETPADVQTPAATDFQAEKKWNTQAESSVAFHAVGVRKPVTKRDDDKTSQAPTPAAIDIVTTESTVCVHRKHAA
jgi:hypothetical protein